MHRPEQNICVRFFARRAKKRKQKLLRYYMELLRISRQRDDLLFVQQLRYNIQTIFFNLLFALNRQYHPGGKRLLPLDELIDDLCRLIEADA